MALSTPWIANKLINGLQVYLSLRSATTLQTLADDSILEFARDSSNLLITIKGGSEYTLRLLEWQVSSTSKIVEAVVSDGEFGIKATFLRNAFVNKHSAEENHSGLTVGATLVLDTFEIRLADYFEPPRVTLHLTQFDVLDGPDGVDRGELPTIHSHELVAQQLSTWKAIENTWIMRMPPSSPAEIRSQIGDQEDGVYDSDVENHDPISISQAQFATQVPLQEASKKARHDVRPDTISKQQGQETIPSRSAATPTKLSLPDLTPKSISAHVETAEDSNGADSSPDLTQQQIVVPLSSVAEGRSNETKQNDIQDGILTESKQKHPPSGTMSQNPEVMPEAIIQVLRDWRKECHDGRYIPRRLQTIPKDQIKLLDSEDRWQPPLVGRVQRLGTVPLDLLNRLTRKVDSAQPKAQVSVHEPTPEIAINETQKHENLDEHGEDTNNSLETASEASEEIEWSSSPPQAPRTHKQLPPDSSPLRAQDTEAVGSSHGHENDRDQTLLAEEPATVVIETNAVVSGSRHNSAAAAADLQEDTDHSVALLDLQHNAPRIPLSSGILPLQSTSNPKSQLIPTTDLQRTVQVKRTPFQQKELSLSDDDLDSPTCIIPGTFDERRVMQRGDAAGKHSTTKTLAHGTASHKCDNTFEADSSEDETVARQNRPACDVLEPIDSSSKKKRFTSPHTTVYSDVDDLCEDSVTHSLKRKSNDDQLTSKKPRRSGGNTMNRIRAGDPAYRVVDEHKVRLRRELLSKIGRKRSTAGLVPSLVVPPRLDTERVSSRAPDRQESDLSSSPLPGQVDQIDTFDTHLSVHRNAEHNRKGGELLEVTSAASELLAGIPSELYRAFTSTYPDYRGQETHFYAGCRLLKSLYLQGRATHPSLWDDFVFRHFHDYREHLRDVMENCGNALPYEKYYEERVEQPAYLRRIVKPSLLDDIQISSTMPARHGLSLMDATRYDAQSKTTSNLLTALSRSVAAENSVSNFDVLPELRKRGSQPQLSSSKSRDTAQATSEAHEAQETRSQEHCQDSRTSVSIWLERAAGVESPILGTPDVAACEGADIPVLSLVQKEIDLPTPSKVSSDPNKRKPFPQALPIGSETPTSSVQVAEPGRTYVGDPTRQRETPSTTKTNRDQKLSRPLTRVSPPPPRKDKAQNRTEGPRIETAFTRFMGLYNELPGEKVALGNRDHKVEKLINIFAWRN